MNRIFLIPLLAAPMLHGMESPNKTVIKLNQEEKFGDADRELHAFAKLPLKPYGNRYLNTMETLGELCEIRDRKARAEAQTTIPALVKAGAKIDSIDPVTKKTPLHLAAEAKNDATMEVLLFYGANPNIRDESGSTPLMKIANDPRNNERDPKITILIKYGARIDSLNHLQSVERCFHGLWILGMEKTPIDTIKKFIDQGAWAFFTWYTLFRALNWAEGKDDNNRSILELILTHPQPGPIWEDEKIKQDFQSLITFFCAVNKAIPQFKPPRDVRLMIRDLVFDDCIGMVPTKNLSRYRWILSKEKLLGKLVERHLKCAQYLNPTAVDEIYNLPKVPENVKVFFYEETREAAIKPLLEKAYEQILTPQETKTT